MHLLVIRLLIISLAASALYPALPAIDNGPHPGKFTFAIVGDQHGAESPDVPEQFPVILKELNILRPDFVITTGDMIEGPSDDEGEIRGRWAEWLDTVAANLDGIPYFPLAGNNDIWSELSARIYGEMFGPMWYSFDYGECHFVALCSEEPGYAGGIGPGQKAWLESDLEGRPDAAHIFCFIHRPLWYQGWEPGWEQWYEEIHPILAENGVDYLLSGHWHVYEDYGEVDGVHCIITGGGGGTLDTRRPEHLGPFYHYLLVTVDGDDVEIAVVKIGSILQSDIVTSEMVDAHRKAMAIFSRQPVLEVGSGLTSYEGIAYFNLDNPFDTTITGEIKWEVSGKGWMVRCPAKFEIPPAGSAQIPITASYYGREPIFTEWPVYKATYDIPSLHGSPFAAEGALRVVPTLKVRQAPRPIVIDGVLSDWAGIDAIELAEAKYVGVFDEWRPDELSMEFRIAWDPQRLYLSCVVTDDAHHQPYAIDDYAVWEGDMVLLGIDSHNADTIDYGDDDFELALSLHEGEAGIQARRAAPDSKIAAGEGMEIAITREWEYTRYELAIDRDALPRDFLYPGAEIGFSILAGDNDGDGWEGFVEWNPGALTFGKDLASFGTVRFDF